MYIIQAGFHIICNGLQRFQHEENFSVSDISQRTTTAVQYTNPCSISSENSGTPFCNPNLLYGESSYLKEPLEVIYRCFTSSFALAGPWPIKFRQFRPGSNLQLLQVFC